MCGLIASTGGRFDNPNGDTGVVEDVYVPGLRWCNPK